MKHLPTITRLAIPAAMVSFLTIEIGRSQHVSGWLVYLIYGAAFCTAVGIELWGIIAGDNLDKSWKLNHGRAWSVLQMIVYVLIGGWLLRHNLTIIMLPLVAALAYVASGFADSLETAVSRQEAETAESVDFDREERAKDGQHRRDLETRQQELDAQNALQGQLAHEQAQTEIATAQARAQVSIANAEARKVKELAKANESQRKPSETLAKADELSGNARLVFEALQRKPESTNVEIAEIIPISPQRVGQIKKELNGRGKAHVL